MNQSDNLDQLAPALAAAQASLNAAKKDGNNPHFKSSYATLQSVWDAARGVLAPNGLSVVQTFEATDGRLMNIRTTLLHKSGQWMTGVLSLAPVQANPQGIGSAITYGRRYALAAILGIVADEDDDGNNASRDDKHHTPERHERQPAPTSRHEPEEEAPEAVTQDGSSWRDFIVPKFIKKYAGERLGKMPEKDLLWWAGNYEPKPYQGRISDADVAFRAALTAAKAELDDLSY